MDHVGRNHERIWVVEFRFDNRGDHAVFHKYYVSVDPDIQGVVSQVGHVPRDSLGVFRGLVDNRVEPLEMLFVVGLWDENHLIEKTAIPDEISLRHSISPSFVEARRRTKPTCR